MALNKEIDYIRWYRRKEIIFHGYVFPFIIIYGAVFYAWLVVYGALDHFELGCIALAVTGVIQVLTCLSCHWSVHVRCALTCTSENDIDKAEVVKVVPTPNNGSPEVVTLHHEEEPTGSIIWFEFQKHKFLYDREEKKEFRLLDFPVDHSFKFYQESKGYSDEDDVKIAQRKYGLNKIEMTVPDFWDLFKERATAPFFVFQVFCVGLWCLDEYWYYSVFTLVMLVIFEATLVQQQQRNMREIRNMGSKPFQLQVYRYRKWRPINSEDLLPGDICSIVRSKADIVIPCDMILLRGSCIVDESMLTGESVPQLKEPIEDCHEDDYFQLESQGKLHVLFSGTKVVNHTPVPKTASGLKAPDNGCVAFVMQTGFNTSQGKLLKTILYGVKRVTANSLETFMFIVFLLIFAITAASYVWIKGTENPKRNRYKLFLECTLILTSVVPPELPIELSLAVNSSLIALHKLGVFCTEPFRIPFAGKVDICCFDKTGTLTSDNLMVEGVAGVGGEDDIQPVENIPMETVRILATCHTLTYVDDVLVGDPMEKALLSSVDWTFTKGDVCLPKKGQRQSLKIAHRYHFTSSLRRMSVIVSMQTGDSSGSNFMVTCKGAPETLKGMFLEVPVNYDEIHRKLSCEGGRVLALGYKIIGDLSAKELRDMTREEVECGLIFGGFAVLSCPLKVDSEQTIKDIKDSSHHIVMITGDNVLTACHVARSLHLSKKTLLALTKCPAEDDQPARWIWQSTDRSVHYDLFPATMRNFLNDYDLAVTGEGLAFLLESPKTVNLLKQILIHVRVFARVDPKQKEFIVNRMKSSGYVVLMCGDGTNDVGALKHSHVGVALLPGSPEKWEDQQEKEKSRKKEKEHKKDKEMIADGEESSKKSRGVPSGKGSSKAARMRAVTRGDTESPALRAANEHQKRLKEMLKELEEQEQSQIVKLGDASIASPFTSRYASIKCIIHVIKQGRCTLVTTLQMFKILALNALILAYCQSVLYLDGVKFSDGQATFQGVLLAGCFLFISRSKPLNTLSKQRPLPNIFNIYTIGTVLCQFAVHFSALYFLVQEVYKLHPKSDEFIDLEKKFEPSLLNSTVYIISVALQISTFAVNYRGHPFMESLFENKPLLYSVGISGAIIFSLAAGWLPDVSAYFEIIDFPPVFRSTLMQVLLLDASLAFVVDRILLWLLGSATLRTT
eukprot:Seg3082.2 transcript_id=Seg3082.2/GoldUCD/mRNA.D3Y31 product="Manganese-transporting ATPase 13A1" protein_id=Seg3082.2/GoldUCD/D3Y31